MNRVVIISAIAFIAFECTPSPRYRTSEEPSTTSKGNKNSKPFSRYASKSSTSSSKSNIVFMKPSKEIPNYDKSKKKIKGIASFYGLDDGFHGKLTANGEVFDMNGMTAAHRTLPLGSLVKVTNLENNKSVTLRINDRGPYVRGRELDCSYGVARDLDFVNKGTASVQIDIIEFGDNKYRLNK